jgi:NitT/TauT family transport system substrate-binding protein
MAHCVRLIIILFIVQLLIMLPVITASTCTKKDTLVVQLNWLMQGEFIALQAAKDLGYFADECLSVSLREGGPDADMLGLLEIGAAQLFQGWFSQMLDARQSRGINLVNIFQHFSRMGFVAVAKKSSGIDSFEKLKGKKIGYWPDISSSLIAALRKFGMNETIDTELIPMSFSSLPLLDQPDRYDAIVALTYNELIQLYEHKKGSKDLWRESDFNILRYEDVGTSMYEDGIYVDMKWYNKNPTANKNILVRFLKAVIKGAMYCRDNEKNCLNLLQDRSIGQYWQIREVNKLIWPSANGVGIIDDNLVQQAIKVLVESNLVTDYSALNNTYTTEFVTEALKNITEEAATSPLFGDIMGASYNPAPIEFCLDKGTGKAYICTGKEKYPIIISLTIILPILVIVIVVLIIIAIAFWRYKIIQSRKIFVNTPLSGNCTVLFTDVQDSTFLWNKDAEVMKEALDQHNNVLRELLVTYQGYEVKTQGDSFMVAFKDPLNAVKWMLAGQLELLNVHWSKKLLTYPSAKFQLDEQGNAIFRGLRVRMGGHYGQPDVVFDKVSRRYDYYGNEINLSARVSGVAMGGQCIISKSLYDIVKDQLNDLIVSDEATPPSVRFLGSYALKGIEMEQEIYEILPLSLSTREFISPKTTNDKSAHTMQRHKSFEKRREPLMPPPTLVVDPVVFDNRVTLADPPTTTEQP